MINNLKKKHICRRGKAMTQYQNSIDRISQILRWNSIQAGTLPKKKIKTAFSIYRSVAMSQEKTKFKLLQIMKKITILSHKSSRSNSLTCLNQTLSLVISI